ncbi:MAG: AAA family ATPase [Candidatus Helarchaeota archaeon]
MEPKQKLMKTGIGVVGLPGAGKSIVSEVGAKISIPTIVMGDVVRQVCIENEMEINHENLGECMVRIRRKEGMNAVAKRILPRIKEIKEELVIIDGLRSYEEVEFFRDTLRKFITIAIHASPHTRYGRIKRRQRYDDPHNYKTFLERDLREIEAGIAKIIALADIMLVNESHVRGLKQRLGKILQLIREGKWR